MYIDALVSHTQKALAIFPNNANIYFRLGNLYTALKEFEKASDHYIEAIRLEPAPSQVYYRLKFSLQAASWFFGSSNPALLKRGEQVLRKAVQEKPEFHFAKVVLGELLAQQDKQEEAISCYTSASYQQTLASYPKLVSESWSNNCQRQPDFLVIGFNKCGTTSLYSYLAAHPRILPAVTKEIRYRTLSKEGHFDLYLAHFPCITDADYMTFEASPSSVRSPIFLRDISKRFPNVKLIVIVRDPTDRAISAFYHQQKPLNHRSSRPLEAAIKNILDSHHLFSNALSHLEKCLTDPPDAGDFLEFYRHQFDQENLEEVEISALSSILASCYIYYFKSWLHHFKEEQILILKSEDLFRQPERIMKIVFDFLDLPIYSLSEYRNFNPNSYPPISDFCRHQLAEFFAPHNQQLESYLGMKFDWNSAHD